MTSGTWLAHHGIKGQKWGERNGPPYPLNPSEDYSKEEKKEAGISSEENQNGLKSLDAPIAEYKNLPVSSSKYFIGKLDPDTGLPLHSRIPDPVDIVKKMNPGVIKTKLGYVEALPGSLNNCAFCTAAYELNRRGYDVKPAVSFSSTNIKSIVSWFKGTSMDDVKKLGNSYRKYDKIEKKMLKELPEHSRGNLMISDYYGGHSVAFEVENGHVTLYDCQLKNYGSIKHVLSACGFDGPDTVLRYLRTDDREIDYEKLLSAGVIRTTSTIKLMVDNTLRKDGA